VGQLATQIELLAEGKFGFDQKYNDQVYHGSYVIYPVICHTDYYFSMPGVNSYLNREFTRRLQPKNPKTRVKDLTVIDLAHLFDMIHHGQTLDGLVLYIDSYHERLSKRRKRHEKNSSTTNFLQSQAGFDAMYRSDFSYEIRKEPLVKRYISDLLQKSKNLLEDPL